MTGFRFAHTDAGDWQGIAETLAEGLSDGPGDDRGDDRGDGRADGATDGPSDHGARLGFLYVTDALAGDFAAILDRLGEATGTDDWVGSVGIGICASGA
ncbi:MAG: hypothetical protein ACE5GT_07190, partial [Rhodospirillales bacterium]